MDSEDSVVNAEAPDPKRVKSWIFLMLLGPVPEDAEGKLGCHKCRYKAKGCRSCRNALGLVETGEATSGIVGT